MGVIDYGDEEMSAEPLRKTLMKQQTRLREIMTSDDQHEAAMQLFMEQHAALHSAKATSPETASLEDLVLDDLTEEQWRHIPKGGEHSIAWAIWHIARIEDMTMNILVADGQQVFRQGAWLEKLNISLPDSGNAMSEAAVAELSQSINFAALRDYRVAVGRRTREVSADLKISDLKEKTMPERLQRIRDEVAVTPDADGIIEYWSKRTIAGLLLMPATRHILVHLNECMNLKKNV